MLVNCNVYFIIFASVNTSAIATDIVFGRKIVRAGDPRRFTYAIQIIADHIYNTVYHMVSSDLMRIWVDKIDENPNPNPNPGH